MATDSKPLKLVLKVGGVTPTTSPSPASMLALGDTPERKLKHKKKKKHKERKEKRRRDELDSEMEETSSLLVDEDSRLSEMDDDGDYQEPASVKKARVGGESDLMPGRALRERKPQDKKGPLYFLLDYLHKNLQKKDGSGIFAFPVTNLIAPRYTEIVRHPMDFSTMRKKIESFQYETVAEFREDFRTMLQNCMLYNHPDTIYYKEAQRLLAIGLKQLSKDRIMSLKRSLPSVSELSDGDVGHSDEEGDLVQVQYKRQKRGHDSRLEAMADLMTPGDVLAQVQQATRGAAHELASRKPGSKMGYLRRREDGSTCLNILNPDNEGVVSDKERVVSLGSLVGKVKSGSQTLAAFREDKRNKATPVSFLHYGSFSSYAPVFDSTTANISKEESRLLLSTYADETGIQYSKSIRNFVEDCGDYAVKMVDDLLDILTQGQHSNMLRFEAQVFCPEQLPSLETTGNNNKYQDIYDISQQEENRKSQEPNEDTLIERLIKEEKLENKQGDKQSSLSSVWEEPGGGVQQDLNRTGELLQELQRKQHERLTTRLTPAQPQPLQPSHEERSLANEVSCKLQELTKNASPCEVVSQSAVRKAIGIVPQSPTPPPTQVHTNSKQHLVQTEPVNTEAPIVPEVESSRALLTVHDDSQDPEMLEHICDAESPRKHVASLPDTSASEINKAAPLELDETAAAVAGIL